MTWHDGEQIIQQHKQQSQDSANNYLIQHPMDPRPRRRPTVRVRVLAYVGGALVTIGYRLQEGYEQMTVTSIEPIDGLRLSRNGTGPAGH